MYRHVCKLWTVYTHTHDSYCHAEEQQPQQQQAVQYVQAQQRQAVQYVQAPPVQYVHAPPVQYVPPVQYAQGGGLTPVRWLAGTWEHSKMV